MTPRSPVRAKYRSTELTRLRPIGTVSLRKVEKMATLHNLAEQRAGVFLNALFKTMEDLKYPQVDIIEGIDYPRDWQQEPPYVDNSKTIYGSILSTTKSEVYVDVNQKGPDGGSRLVLNFEFSLKKMEFVSTLFEHSMNYFALYSGRYDQLFMTTVLNRMRELDVEDLYQLKMGAD